MICRIHSFQKFTESQGNNVVDAPVAYTNGFLLSRNTCFFFNLAE
jgi:hypothetical protein